MEDYNSQVVCCMCGDVGFSEKLFRCFRCRNRHQHSYCSNYYSESSDQIEQCDWCRSESRKGSKPQGSSSRKSTSGNGEAGTKSEYSGGDTVKQNERDDTPGDHRVGKSGGGGGVPSPRTATRRYKLLKDVMC